MQVPLNSNIHYKCSFLIEESGEKANWSHLVGAFSYWISSHYAAERIDGVGKPWFKKGGVRSSSRYYSSKVKTDSLRTDEFGDKPHYWTLRFEHNGRENEFRRWRTDIGVESKSDDTYQVSTVVTHRLAENYVGEKPETPTPTAPWFLRFLASRDEWSLSVGPDPVKPKPFQITSDEASTFWDALRNPKRQVFAIALAADTNEDEPNTIPSESSRQEVDIICAGLNADELARLLVCNAIVCICPSREAINSLNSHVPDEYRLESGMARIYRPDLDPDDKYDFKRHRFFTKNEMYGKGEESVQNIIIESVARRSRSRDKELFSSLEDLEAKRRNKRIREIRGKGKEKENYEELVSLLEEDVEHWKQESKEYKSLLDSEDKENKQLKKDIDRLESEVKRLKYEKREMKKSSENSIAKKEVIENLPKSFTEVVSIMEGNYPERIEILESAKRSAEVGDFEDVSKGWECLRDIAIILHTAYFEIEGANIESYFNSKSKFEVATGPSPRTRDDKELMRKRKKEYEPDDIDSTEKEVIDISAHVKARSGDNFLRVHYHPHNRLEKIIIGHCGNHLDTAGTRRRS